MIVNDELMAFARGFAEGVAGTDTLPYHQIDEKHLVKVYRVGHAHGVLEGWANPAESRVDADGEDNDVEPAAVPIRAKTAG